MAKEEFKIFSVSNITAEQIINSTLAIPAFVPATVCTGYTTGWFTNLHGFRQRSLVERIFWSLPLSLAVSTIASVLIGKFLSLTAFVLILLTSAALTVGTLAWEWFQLRRSGTRWSIGWNPSGGKALALAILWIVVVVLSLVDIQSGHKLYMSLTIFDHAPRTNWTESVIRTGVPPDNSLYMFKQPVAMRYYYFWYVVCAAIARMAYLPARAVFIASCVWSGFALAALSGIYLKHFLQVGTRLRKQFLCSIGLLMVAGIGAFVNFLHFFGLAPSHIEGPAEDQITSWLISLLYVPHHLASAVCCMLAFLLASIAGRDGKPERVASVALIAAALASAFGLSLYVAFAFFLVMLAWAFWQIAVERVLRPALLLAAGGAGACILLLPYLAELTHTSSKLQGGALFVFAVRQLIPPDGLMATGLFQHLATGHPLAALNLAKFLLLVPGYALELGFYFAVLLIYLVPSWRGSRLLTPTERSLVFIVVAVLPIISFVRSGVLDINDFGLRAALLMQFPLLLCGSEVITAWSLAKPNSVSQAQFPSMLLRTPSWLRSITALALIAGVIGTTFQAIMLRFFNPLLEAARTHSAHDADASSPSHNAYISAIGYSQLDAAIPQNGVVQFNPIVRESSLWSDVDWVGIDHQTVIATDQPWCGAELGGDPSGCQSMATAIDALYRGGSAEQAHATCMQYGIQYLVARIYDPPWKDKAGWVWTLKPVVADDEFRALDCRQ